MLSWLTKDVDEIYQDTQIVIDKDQTNRNKMIKLNI